jgi:CO/xanthine dehydrogenase Mo-binding subunit
MKMERFSRRDFLKTSGALVVTFPLAHPLADAAEKGQPAKTVANDQVDGYLAIDSRGRVTVYSGKVDLGTGVYTALIQMAADELYVPLERVTLVQGDTALTPDQGNTWGSLTIQAGGLQIRQACATAREALLERAAQKLGAAKGELAVRDGVVSVKSDPRKSVTYGQLVGGKSFQMKLDAKAPLKPPSEYTLVGKSINRLDIPGKITGKFTYMHDFRRPGMLHARVVRPAGMRSELQSLDDSAARKIPGYVTTVRKGNFVAAVARNEWAAIKGAGAIKASWSSWEGLPDKSRTWEHVRNTKVVRDETFQSVGDTAKAMAAGARQLSATYDFAVHTHAGMGPSCAVAEMKDGKLSVWSSSQATHMLRRQLAKMLSMKADDIRCLYIEGSGCYGRNGHEDAAAEAALIVREIGKPVRLQWSRADEQVWSPKGPPTLLENRAALDANGNVVAWEITGYMPNRPKGFEVTLTAAELSGLPKDTAFPGNIFQSLAVPYTFPNIKATARWLAETPFKPSWIRTPGRMQNTYANECFMDECAAAAGADPVEYRLKNLKDPRGAECIDRCVRMANWTPRGKTPRDKGDIARGRGFSYVKYELVRTYVAVVADVSVNRRTGHVKVDRFYVAHDCGQVINPDGLRNQIEGNVVQTVSRTLIEDLKWDRSTVRSIDWETYPILKFPDVPAVHTDLIDRPNERPWGAGEPTAAVVPSAIANAIYDAIGMRLRSVPFTPDKVLAALKTA